MIRHICMFTLADDNKEAHIAQFLERGQALCQLPTIQNGQVVRKTQNAPNANYDVALIFDFNTIDDLNAYQVCPQHVAFGQFVGAIRTDRACIDYEF